MAVGCGATFAKIMLIIFNIIFLCTGLILIALGIWLLVTLGQSWGPSQIFTLASGSYLFRNSAILLIALGCAIIFITIFGLVAAFRESAILLSIYAGLLFIIFAGEIAGGVVAIVYKDRIIDSIESTLEETLEFKGNNSYYETVPDKPNQCKASLTGKLWDYVQIWFTCCGINDGDVNNGYIEQKINPCNVSKDLRPSQTHQPLTCCLNNVSLSDFDAETQEKYIGRFDCSVPITADCTGKIKAWVVRFAPVLIGIGLGFAMFELFGFIFVICLCMNTEKGFKRF